MGAVALQHFQQVTFGKPKKFSSCHEYTSTTFMPILINYQVSRGVIVDYEGIIQVHLAGVIGKFLQVMRFRGHQLEI